MYVPVCNYFVCSIIIVVLTIFVSVVSLKLHHTTQENAKEMPAWVSVKPVVHLRDPVRLVSHVKFSTSQICFFLYREH